MSSSRGMRRNIPRITLRRDDAQKLLPPKCNRQLQQPKKTTTPWAPFLILLPSFLPICFLTVTGLKHATPTPPLFRSPGRNGPPSLFKGIPPKRRTNRDSSTSSEKHGTSGGSCQLPSLIPAGLSLLPSKLPGQSSRVCGCRYLCHGGHCRSCRA